jgi:hypothetical protein
MMAEEKNAPSPKRGVSKQSVFQVVVAITFLCIALSAVFAMWGPDTEACKQLRGMCAMGWQCGLASLLTLLGVKGTT